MALAPVREAADSLAKASTPEPFSTSRTSNWVARVGGLPDYIQHIAHDLVEKRGKSTSNAIQMAIGIVKRWCAGGGKVDANTKAAACKAASEWEAKKAASHAKVAHSDVEKWRMPSLADEFAIREAALERLAIFERDYGGTDGMMALLAAEGILQEAAWTPKLKRTASAPDEIERHEVYDGGQHVGTIAARRAYDPGKPNRHAAFAVNGTRVTDYSTSSRADALKALQSHLEEAPARVVSLPTAGKFLVAKPSTYDGQTTFTQFSSEQAARHAAGLPPAPTEPERSSKVAALAETLRFDLMTVSAVDIPPLRRVQEARRRDPFELAEDFHPGELRDFHGRWRGGGRHASIHPSQITPGARAPRTRAAADVRYEGGVPRAHAQARQAHARKPQISEKDLPGSIGEEHNGPGARAGTAAMLKQPQMSAGELERQVAAGKALDTEHAHRKVGADGKLGPYSAERKRLHEAIITNLLQGKAVHEGSARAVFTAGGGASGKSAMIKSGAVKVPSDAVIVNPDVVREMLPEYKALKAAGREDAASLTHEESSHISKVVMRIALARQHHILIDSVGDSGPGKFAGKIRAAQAAGHNVSVHYATVPLAEAIKRADKRGDETGRYVDHGTLAEAHAGASARFPEVAKIRGIHVQVFNTMQRNPPLIAERRPGDNLTIGDKREYEAFLRKAEEAM